MSTGTINPDYFIAGMGILLLIVVVIFFIVLINKNRKLRALNISISEAIKDFHINEEPLELEEITMDYARSVLEKHRLLYDTICSTKDISFPWRKSCCNLFRETYDSYIDKVTSHNRLVRRIKLVQEQLPLAVSEIREQEKRFFAFTEWKHLKNKYGEVINIFKQIAKTRFAGLINLSDGYWVEEVLKDETFRKKNNAAFITRELDDKKSYFDDLLSYPLDKQQRLAILKSEDNCLVISSAGSGKTSTIVGKAKYLIELYNVKPDEILLVSFTRKAAEELRNRIGEDSIHCATFHKLALDIVTDYNHARPSICDGENTFRIVLESLLQDDSFKCALLDLYSVGQLVLSHDYEDSQDYFRDAKKHDPRALLPDMDNKPIYTKSIEEKMICFFLSSLGLDFRYEEQYEYPTADLSYKQYKPDFSIYYKDKEGNTKRIYLEHFAINRQNQVPKWFAQVEDDDDEVGKEEKWKVANDIYNAGIVWKRKLHEQKKTVLIETHSYDFHEENVLDVLKAELTRVGVPFNVMQPEELYSKVTTFNKRLQEMAFNMISSFVQLMKSNCKNIDHLIEEAKEKYDTRNTMIMSSIIKPFYNEYCSYLKQRGELDFSDIISLATDICESNNSYKKYKYILVDEFQDISFDRYKFLQSLRSDRLFTKLFCVGDDWQSIYRFTGSDMRLFTNFKDFFGCTEECKIETTYRFSEPTVSISSQFIQINPSQKTKEIRPFYKDAMTELSFASYNANNTLPELLCSILETIPTNKSVYIISRYNFDFENIISDNFVDKYISKSPERKLPINLIQERNRTPYLTIASQPERKCKFFSVHSSKGLEADYIILINCNSGIYGFPATIEDDPVLTYVLSEEDHFTYAEERRLFYVAITRAREHTYVLYDSKCASDFVMEVDGNKASGNPVCPRCKNGNLEVKREGTTRYGNKFQWYCCNNNVCDYNKTVFDNTKQEQL